MNKAIFIDYWCLRNRLCAAPKMPNLDRWIKLSIPRVDKANVMQKVLFVQKRRSKFIPWSH